MIEGRTADPAAVWEDVAPLGELFTCYSSALAVWAAFGSGDWRSVVNTGLHLRLVEADDRLFGFSHFPAALDRVGLERRSAEDAGEAVEGILDELATSGRVIVAGDGFNLPWHVAAGRRHVPHWFVIARRDGDAAVVDPFTCRNDLGLQQPCFEGIEESNLPSLAAAVPLDDPVVALREAFALGTDDRPLAATRYRWLRRGGRRDPTAQPGVEGAGALRRLADHFRSHVLHPEAYRQADDLWSVARHRAFFVRVASEGDEGLRRFAEEHGSELVRRWGHVSPLLMQATLALAGGRTPTSSLPDTLDELAEREERAAAALPVGARLP
jgi:hypothetical protein